MENFGKDWSSKITKAQAGTKSAGKGEPRTSKPQPSAEGKARERPAATTGKRPQKSRLDGSSDTSDSLKDFVANEASDSEASSEAVPRRKKQIAKRPPQTKTPQSNSVSKSSNPPLKKQSTVAKLKKTGKPAPRRRPEPEESEEEPSESYYTSEASEKPKKRQQKKAPQPARLDDSDLELIEKNVSVPRAASRGARPVSGSSQQQQSRRKPAASDSSDASDASDRAPKQSQRGRRKIVDSQDEDESY